MKPTNIHRGESLYGPGKHAYFVIAKDSNTMDCAMAVLKNRRFTMECNKSSPSACVWHVKGNRTEAEEILRGMEKKGIIESYAEDDVPAMHI